VNPNGPKGDEYGGCNEENRAGADSRQSGEVVWKRLGLVTAGTKKSFNTMTIAWGTLGVLWHKPVCVVYVRPTRHTFQFMEKADRFTVSFFPRKYREALTYCGTHSGRDVNKIAETGLTPVAADGTVHFAEARLVLVCRKLYRQDILPELFETPSLDKIYPKKDYHRV